MAGRIGEDSAMTIDIISSKDVDSNIKFSDLKAVTNPIDFEKGGVPTIDGLFSEYIFGSTQEERMKLFGYIDLKKKFIHPYVYEVLLKLQKNIDSCCKGEGAWDIVDKNLVPIKNPTEEQQLQCGIDWFIKNFKRIDFRTNDSKQRNDRVKFINSLSDDELFISKFLVQPVMYRDVDKSSDNIKVPEINDLYRRIIRFVNMLGDNTLSFVSTTTMYNIQMVMVEIRKYFQQLIAKKNGFFRQAVMGKNVDYGFRSVISNVDLTSYHKPSDNPVGLGKTGIPLAQCCTLGFPFIMHWVMEFFRKEFESSGAKYPVMRTVDGKQTLEYIQLKDPLAYYTEDMVHNRIDLFVDTPETRFDPVLIPLPGDNAYGKMTFAGSPFIVNKNKGVISESEISHRYMTWTDLLYMAAVDMLERDKHVYITRYPITDYFSTFPTGIHVLSTMKTMPIKINNTIYKYYPIINPSANVNDIAVAFNDTVTMASMYLSGIQGDYDGDQISLKLAFTQEANAEAAQIIKSIQHYIAIDGSLVRKVGNEIYLTYYNLTAE